MEIVSGVFEDRGTAQKAFEGLIGLGIPKKKVVFLMPGTGDKGLETEVPLTDSESAGMGGAMGATVGGALGAASGATLGLAAASLAVPGVGPVIAVGMLAAGVFGIAGAATGYVAGDSLEESLGEGLPHEDAYIYEEALRLGHTVVIAFAENDGQADGAREIMRRNHALDFDGLRDSWWKKLREDERADYTKTGRDFDHDEPGFRRGFQAALHPNLRGKSYVEAETELRKSYSDEDLDTAFIQGYERGRHYHITIVELFRG